MFTTILTLVLSVVADALKVWLKERGNKNARMKWAKQLRDSYDEHQKAWQKAKTTGDTSDLERLP